MTKKNTIADPSVAQARARRVRTGMTPETVATVLGALEAGMSIEKATQVAGISSRCWRMWIERGRTAVDELAARDVELEGIPTFAEDASARAGRTEHPGWRSQVAVKDRPYVALVVEADQRRAKGELTLIQKIQAADDWRASAHLLACRNSQWSLQARVQLSGDQQHPLQIAATAPAPANTGEVLETMQALADSNQLDPAVVDAWGVVAGFLAGTPTLEHQKPDADLDVDADVPPPPSSTPTPTPAVTPEPARGPSPSSTSEMARLGIRAVPVRRLDTTSFTLGGAL